MRFEKGKEGKDTKPGTFLTGMTWKDISLLELFEIEEDAAKTVTAQLNEMIRSTTNRLKTWSRGAICLKNP